MVVVPDTVAIEIGPQRLQALLAYGLSRAPRELVIVEGADQLLEEPGTIDQLEHHAIRWFGCHLAGDGGA